MMLRFVAVPLQCVCKFASDVSASQPPPLSFIIDSDAPLLCISYLCTYDLYSLVSNVFDACRSITRASERGLGPGNRDIIGTFGAQKS